MNFVRLFRDYHIPFIDTVNRGWLNCSCPHCNDKSFNGGFNLRGNYFNCWKCGAHDLYQTLQYVIGVPASSIKSLLAEYDDRSEITYDLNKKQTHAASLSLSFDPLTKAERKYLRSRNYDPDLLQEKYHICSGGIAGAWKYRIIIPLFYHGKLITYQGRTIINDKKPRYKTLSIEQSIMNPKDIFFNLDNAMRPYAFLLEGPFDVMRMGDNFICSLGTTMTETQIELLYSRYKKIFILFDNEVEAQEKAHRYGIQLHSIGLDVEIIDAFGDFGCNDAGELTPEQSIKLRQMLL